MILGVMAANTVSVNPLNYGGSPQNATVSITNTEGIAVTYTATLPSGWTANSGSGCVADNATGVHCSSVANGNTVTFFAQNPSSVASHTLSTITLTTTSDSITNAQLLRIDASEIFYTLVEYGRGDGDYMYSSKGDFKSETGYPYLPENTSFELNFLHKLFNIRQYFGQPYTATGATFSCTYPGDSLIRTHLDTNTILAQNWTVNYSVDEIPTSWERMGYAGIQFSARVNGTTLNVACRNIQYTMNNGVVSVPTDAVILQVVTINPLSVVASSIPSTINEGDSEVIITYTMTNNAPYIMMKPTVQIDSPSRAQFIGVRGELWGTGQSEYTQVLTELQPGETYAVSLLARYNTTGLASQNLALSRGIEVQFIPPWQANAYNPKTVIQYLPVSSNITYISGTPASINSVQSQLNHIYVQVDSINSTVNNINTTTNAILALEQFINVTFEGKLDYMNNTLNQINTTVNNLDTASILSYLSSINSTVNNLNTAQLIAYLANINATTTNDYDLDLYFNNTVFAGVTLPQLYAQINGTFAQIQQNTTAILNSIRSFRDFQEEAVFLVTDAQVYGQEAKTQFDAGNLGASADNLQKAATSLEQAQKVMDAKEATVYANNLNLFQRAIRWVTNLF